MKKITLSKIITFAKSLLFHIGAGFPKSNQELINQRYTVCESCENFEKDQCLVCGCNINKKKIFLNKLAWKDQKCPLEKW